MKIYLAAPLFNEMERERNFMFCDLLENNGFVVYLPQRDGGLFYDFIKEGYSSEEARKHIFIADTKAICDSDIILCFLDGRVLDEGMCIELGIAYAQGKICIGYKTDQRSQDEFGNNIMLDGVLSDIFSCKNILMNFLLNIKKHKPSLKQGENRTIVDMGVSFNYFHDTAANGN